MINTLCIDKQTLEAIAKKHGTPCYVYSKPHFIKQWQLFENAFDHYPHQICFAVKANSNLAILHTLAKLGSGFDIVSGGELARTLKVGADPKKIIFSGVGKTDEEILAALDANIGCFNVESEHELHQLNANAKSKGKKAPIAFRINPDISVETHPYMATGLKENKFGIPYDDALRLYQEAKQLPHIHIIGIACHLGSQIMNVEPYLAAIDVLLSLYDALEKDNIDIQQIDIGGGFGIHYQEDKKHEVDDFIKPIVKKISDKKIKLLIEPGRAIVATSGILLTKVLSLKNQSGKHFAIVDAGMNDLLRPALYDAWHNIVPLSEHKGKQQRYDVVGPVCETGDFIGKNRLLCIKPDDLLAVSHCGAYGFVLSSNFNTRPRACEVMVDDHQFQLIRQRETLEDLMKGEFINDFITFY